MEKPGPPDNNSPFIENSAVEDQTTTFPDRRHGRLGWRTKGSGGLLNHTPSDSGLAFVVIQHLSPLHNSMMVDLLKRHTAMPVITIVCGDNTTKTPGAAVNRAATGGKVHASRPDLCG